VQVRERKQGYYAKIQLVKVETWRQVNAAIARIQQEYKFKMEQLHVEIIRAEKQRFSAFQTIHPSSTNQAKASETDLAAISLETGKTICTVSFHRGHRILKKYGSCWSGKSRP
jgi:Tfp pilus assembly major pilin PilA